MKIFVEWINDVLFWKIKTMNRSWEEYEVENIYNFLKYSRYYIIDKVNKKFIFPDNLREIKNNEYCIKIDNEKIIASQDNLIDKNEITIILKNDNIAEIFPNISYENNVFYLKSSILNKVEVYDDRIRIRIN